MTRPRFTRTIGFRLTALYVGLFAASIVLLFGIVYWVATASLDEQLRLSLRSEMASLEAKSATEPVREIAADINQRLASATPQAFFYSLRDRSGRQLAGNLPDILAFDGWRELPWGEDNEDGTRSTSDEEMDHALLALGRRLSDGGHLIVAADTSRLDEAEESIIRAFAWAAGATLLLALVGGIALSQGFLHRVDAINRTMHAIMRGALADRIQTRGTGDELDELGRNLNDMLDRLQNLMEGLKQVSNDVAHDLRTPLSRLKQRLETARLDASSVQDYEQAIDQALQDADVALSTFSALLRIAQIEAGTRRANFADLDLSLLLTNLTMTYAAVAEDAGKSATSSVLADLHTRGDRELLTQMFVNLIENAMRHTPSGGHINISLMKGAQGPIAEIADDGPGIPETERPNVFRRFYRLEGSRSTPGSGLGLALVAAVAELHGARITLADNKPGLQVTIQFNT